MDRGPARIALLRLRSPHLLLSNPIPRGRNLIHKVGPEVPHTPHSLRLSALYHPQEIMSEDKGVGRMVRAALRAPRKTAPLRALFSDS